MPGPELGAGDTAVKIQTQSLPSWSSQCNGEADSPVDK